MSGTPYTVRAAQTTDIPAIVEAWHAMRLEASLNDDELVPDWHPQLTLFLQQRLDQGSAAIWLAVQGERVLGTTLVLLKDDYPFCLFAPGFYGFIGCVYTVPTARRQGIATLLVQRAVGWAREHGAHQVRLLPTPASQALYERFGFGRVEDLQLTLY